MCIWNALLFAQCQICLARHDFSYRALTVCKKYSKLCRSNCCFFFFTTGNVNGETEDGWPTLPKIFAYIISAQWLRSTVWNIASFNWRKPKIIVYRGHGSCCCCCCVFCDVKAFARAMHIYIWTQSLICYQMAQCCFAIRFVMLHITSTAMVTSSSPAASIRTANGRRQILAKTFLYDPCSNKFAGLYFKIQCLMRAFPTECAAWTWTGPSHDASWAWAQERARRNNRLCVYVCVRAMLPMICI